MSNIPGGGDRDRIYRMHSAHIWGVTEEDDMHSWLLYADHLLFLCAL